MPHFHHCGSGRGGHHHGYGRCFARGERQNLIYAPVPPLPTKDAGVQLQSGAKLEEFSEKGVCPGCEKHCPLDALSCPKGRRLALHG